MAQPHAYSVFVAQSNGKIDWVDGYVGGIRFQGFPTGTLTIHGKMTDMEKQVAREVCRNTFSR